MINFLRFLRLKGKINFLVVFVVVVGLFSFKRVSDEYFEVSKNIDIFCTAYREINVNYVEKTEPGELMKTGLDAMLKSLDPYTVYYPESDIETYRFESAGEYGGIGAEMFKRKDGTTVISKVYEDFPAHKAGLKPGDVVENIEGKQAKELSMDEIGTLVKGSSGTKLIMKVRRDGTSLTKKIWSVLKLKCLMFLITE